MKKLLVLTLLLPSLLLAQTNIGSSRVLTVTPTISTGAYTAGDAVGGLQTLSGAGRSGIGSGLIQNIAIDDLDSESADIDIVVFTSNPTATTVTDNAALDINDADLSKVICVISITSDALFADNATSSLRNVGCSFRGDIETGTIYVAAVTRSTPTYTTTADLIFRYAIIQD